MKRPDHTTTPRRWVTSDTGPVAIVPLWLVQAIADEKPGAMGSALAVYVVLHKWTDRDGECFPSQKSIASEACCSLSTVQAALALLRDVGAVTWQQTVDVLGDPGPNVYMVHRARGGSPDCSGEGSPDCSGEGSPDCSGTNQIQCEPDPLEPVNDGATDVATTQSHVDAERLANLMADLLAQRDTESGRPTVTKGWINDMRLLIDKDGRTATDIERVLRWLDAGSDDVSSFWRPNVRSPKKLRSRWATMAEQYQRRRQATRAPSRHTETMSFLAEAAQRAAERDRAEGRTA